jgi:hypothetical protein
MADHPFTAIDDDFHPPTPGDKWFTETSWFSFNVPERKMGCWLYGWARRNMNNTGGGVFVWDPSATDPWNLPYFKYGYTQPLPEPADLRDFTFPESYSVKVLEPLTRYKLSYRDRDIIAIDAEFTALFPPHTFKHGEPPFVDSPHLDQMGHITGTLVLNGETIPIDSFSIRDRSWGTRMDHRGNRIGYPFGCAKDIAFCLFAVPNKDYSDRNERINHGFLWEDGRKLQLAPGGVRHVERDPQQNWATRMEIDARDTDGRKLHAIGEVESRFFLLNPRGICINSSIRWQVNGKTAYGEDQDVWRLDQWRAARRKLGQLP